MDSPASKRMSYPASPVSPDALTPHLQEIKRLKLQLLQIQNMINSQDELILSVRQNLLRRMVQYLKSVKTATRSSQEYEIMMSIKDDLDTVLNDQNQLVVSLRQQKLKQLVEMNPNKNNNKSNSKQTNLTRQISRSAEDLVSGTDLDYNPGPKVNRNHPFPRAGGLKRSETTRAERSFNFSELAKRRGAGVKRNKTMYDAEKRKSLDDIYERFSEVYAGRSSVVATPERQKHQPLLKLDNSGQLVFDSSTSKTPSDSKLTKASDGKSGKPANGISPSAKKKKPVEKLKLVIPRSETGKQEKTQPTSTSSCHTDENPMLSADKDFVDVDDLVHFIQNHKPPPQPFVRGFNSVNSASFREAPTYATENAKVEVMPTKRDQIVLGGAPVKGRMERVSLQPRTQHEPLSVTQTDRIHVSGQRKLTQPDVKPKESLVKTVPTTTTQHQYENVPSAGEHNEHSEATREGRPSVNSLEEEVEFASNLMIRSALNRGNENKTNIKESSSYAKDAKNRHEVPTTSHTAPNKDAVNAAMYANVNPAVSNGLGEGHSHVQTSTQLTPVRDDELSPVFRSFKEFSEQLNKMNIKTSSRSNMAEESDTDSDDTFLPSRGQAPKSACKPVLLKKPPRKSVKKKKRRLSRSLTDVSSLDKARYRIGQSNFDHPSSGSGFDKDHVYDVPKPRRDYANIGDVPILKGQREQRDKLSGARDDIHVDAPRMEKIKVIKTHEKQSQKDVAETCTRYENLPHVVKTCTDNEPHVSKNLDKAEILDKAKSKRKESMRRSSSDNIIYQQNQKRIRQDLHMLSELQDEIEETTKMVKSLWVKVQMDMLNMPNYHQPKRSTLPKAAAPNFGRKWKCIVM